MSINKYEETKKNLGVDDPDFDNTSLQKLCDNHYIKLEHCNRLDIEDDDGRSGLYIQKENTDLECGKIKIPIFYSSMVHSVAALYFFFVMSFCNLWYVGNLITGDHKHNTGYNICVVLAVLNVVSLPTFIFVQALIKMRWGLGCQMKNLRIVSFIFECLSGLVITLLAVVASMKRNNDVDWFK